MASGLPVHEYPAIMLLVMVRAAWGLRSLWDTWAALAVCSVARKLTSRQGSMGGVGVTALWGWGGGNVLSLRLQSTRKPERDCVRGK